MDAVGPGSRQTKQNTALRRIHAGFLPHGRSASGGRCRDYLLMLLLATATLLAFYQVLSCGFVNYDDDSYVYDNPHLRTGLSVAGIRWAVTAIHAGYWIPLTWLSLLLDYQLYGLAAWGYHLTNLLWHTANACLAYLFFRRCTGQPYRSFVAAALFALHPLRVESVAWVTERKDVLSVCFGLLSLLAYQRYAVLPTLKRYLLVTFTFVLSLLAKPMLVTLPCLFLLLDWWPLRRMRGTADCGVAGEPAKPSAPTPAVWLLVEKIPLLLLAAACSAVAWQTGHMADGLASLEEFPLTTRMANALVSYVRYLVMTAAPLGLAPLYPLAPDELPAWKVVGAALLLVTLSVLAVRRARSRPDLFVGWFWYLGTLVPVIGLVQVGTQALADRFTYFPSLGLVLALTWCAADALQALGWPVRWRVALVTVLLVLSAAWTGVQTLCWRDSVTLWSRTLQVTARTAVAHNNLGMALQEQGRLDDVLAHYQEAVAINPLYIDAHNNLGLALQRMGRIDEAVAHFQEALRLNPKVAAPHNNWGNALQAKGCPEEAVTHYQTAVLLNPSYAEAHNNWGVALQNLGHSEEAMAHYQEALRLQPGYAAAHNNWGIVLQKLRRLDEAAAHYQEAARLNPTYAEAHLNWGNALFGLGRIQESLAHYQEAARLLPSYAEAQFNWGIALRSQGRYRDAEEHLQQALRLKPDLIPAR